MLRARQNKLLRNASLKPSDSSFVKADASINNVSGFSNGNNSEFVRSSGQQVTNTIIKNDLNLILAVNETTERDEEDSIESITKVIEMDEE